MDGNIKYFMAIIMMAVAFVIYIPLNKRKLLGVLVGKADKSLQADNIALSSSIVKYVLKIDKNYIPAKYIKSKIHVRQGQFYNAISELNSILANRIFNRYINEIDIRKDLISLYENIGNHGRVFDEYKRILIINPDDIDANYRVGIVMFQKKNYSKSIKHLEKVKVSKPDLPDIRFMLGVSYYNINNFQEAEEHFIEEFNSSRNATASAYYLGHIYMKKKRFDEALTMFEEAKNCREYYLRSIFNMGIIHFEKGDASSARELLEKGIFVLDESSEYYSEYLYLLAGCYELESRYKEAVKHWKKIIATKKNFKDVKDKIATYTNIIATPEIETLFTLPLENLLPLITELISQLNYNIISFTRVSNNEYCFKAYNVKRHEAPLLINFIRSTSALTIMQVNDFLDAMFRENCKNGIILTTSFVHEKIRDSIAAGKIIIYDSDYVFDTFEKLNNKNRTKFKFIANNGVESYCETI